MPHDLVTPQGIVTLQIWDTAGQEQYRSIGSMYTRGAAALIVVYNVVVQNHLDEAKTWLEQSRTTDCELQQDVYIVGNQIDLASSPEPTDPGQEYAESIGAYFHSTSAKTGEGIQQLFQELAGRLAQRPVRDNGARGVKPVASTGKKKRC
jgi:Ras-related protein Rab-5C